MNGSSLLSNEVFQKLYHARIESHDLSSPSILYATNQIMNIAYLLVDSHSLLYLEI